MKKMEMYIIYHHSLLNSKYFIKYEFKIEYIIHIHIMQNELICIICFGKENLKSNKLCYNNCKFFYHKCCYIQWQKVQQNEQSTCIICKEPIINFITGEVSLINPLARFNNLEIENINANTARQLYLPPPPPPPPPPYPPPSLRQPSISLVSNESQDDDRYNEFMVKLLCSALIIMLALVITTVLLTIYS